MKKGFTLMEILAVLLVIAVVVSMAVPVFRSVRFEIRNGQAQTASKKLAEAMRMYYQVSRGLGVQEDCFIPSTAAGENVLLVSPATCVSPSSDGIPYQNSTTQNASRSAISQLFACGYLSYKDFLGLPYEFCTCNPVRGGAQPEKCQITEATGSNTPFVVVRGADGAGNKYTKDDYYIFVDQSMKVADSAE